MTGGFRWTKWAKYVLLIVLVGLAVGLAVGFRSDRESPASRRILEDQLNSRGLGKRVLVVAPHPDDEGLATGGLIKQCVSRGIDVLVVVVTCGDGCAKDAEHFFHLDKASYEDQQRLGQERSQETRNAMQELGLPPDHIIFLGYPDGGTDALWDFYWDPDNLHTGTNGADHSPYPFTYEKGAPYCGENLVRNLESIIEDFQPTSIIYPDPLDEHQDHWAVNAFVQYVIARLGYYGEQYTYLVHYPDFPYPQAYCPDRHILPPTLTLRSSVPWRSLPLTPLEEDDKRETISEYTAPLLDLGKLMVAFIRKNELFGSARVIHLDSSGTDRQGSKGHPGFSVNIYDPVPSSFMSALDPGVQFELVGLREHGETVTVDLSTSRPLNPEYMYVFHLRIFRKEGVSRLDVYVIDGKARYLKLAKNSITPTGEIHTRFTTNTLSVEIPSHLFQDADEFMVSVDTVFRSKRIEKTPYHSIVLRERVPTLYLYPETRE